jgi:hypothetical protein
LGGTGADFDFAMVSLWTHIALIFVTCPAFVRTEKLDIQAILPVQSFTDEADVHWSYFRSRMRLVDVER